MRSIHRFGLPVGIFMGMLGFEASAADLSGVSILAQWRFPNGSTVIASQSVIDGPGVEISCPGIGSFCSEWGSTKVSYDFGPDSISFSAPDGTGHAQAAFNGFTFSGLAAGGVWAAAGLSTNILGLTASRLSFDGDTVTLNVQGLAIPVDGQWTITLTSAVPEVSGTLLMASGLPLVLLLGISRSARRRTAVAH